MTWDLPTVVQLVAGVAISLALVFNTLNLVVAIRERRRSGWQQRSHVEAP
jgi:hypothetical protein